MLILMAAVTLVLPLIYNLRLWRQDLVRIRKLTAMRKEIPLLTGDVPRVSFLIAAWNEESTLRSCIEAIERLSYPSLEIVLCAGGTDRTGKIASELNDLRLILLVQQPGDGKQKSLRRCLEQASGEIIYLLDAGGLINDAAFARILGPILSGGEQVVTGSPCTPLPGQIANPFVVSQCASQVYTSIHQPEYSSGLLGANCAILRRKLEQAGGFNAATRTGGDYDLGKRLLRQGSRVRYVADASFPIEFHTQVRAYLRQQSRWIRNVVIHGVRFGAYREVLSCLSASLIGLAMLVLPCLALVLEWSHGSHTVARICAAVWTFAFLHACCSRVRYVKVAERWLGVRFPRHVLALLPLFLLIDFVAWSIPLVQYQSRALRERW
ncbi:MAG: glycosyltransferase family 2 protein [Bryobacteraceae bacterium]|jgi:cellulose synthase/poly-beta-1,6-N-acetylglucosamine synthase-like glycosyltransferase